MKKLSVIKVGGKIVEEQASLELLLNDFAKIEGDKILVHGGGRSATKIAEQLGITTKMVDGRRITDKDMLEVVTMVYGGLVNKKIVAQLQSRGVNALGLTGADMNIIQSKKRPVVTIDYGYVGDVEKVNSELGHLLLKQHIVPVFSPLTHDKKGAILNTNADTIAAEVAKAMSTYFDVTLIYCFEKKGVLRDAEDDESVIERITVDQFESLVSDKIIQGGMIPKLQNACEALQAGVKEVVVTKADELLSEGGTKITL